MIEYKIVETQGDNITLETKDTSKKSIIGETTFTHKTMKKEDAIKFLNNIVQQRQQQLAFLTQKVNSEIASAENAINIINS
jgi:cell division septum initiation protein DivIVA